MLIEIQADVFDSTEWEGQIRKIIQDFAYKRRYDYFIDLSVVGKTEVFENLYESNKELIVEYFNKQINENREIDYFISNSENSKVTFSVEDSIKFFNQPVQIILENNNNDSYFIDALINNFKKSGKKIKRFKEERWLSYAMGGGAENIINFIEAEKKGNEGNNKFLRCFVLVDSDLECPKTPNPKRRTLESYLELNEIPYHVLEKREMENYMPDEIIENIPKGGDFITTYLKLVESQKDFIDLEAGFQSNKETLEKRKRDVFEFYQDLDEKQIENLRYGLKDNFGNFKSEFPKLFEEATQDGLINRTKHQKDPKELQNILNKINALL